MGNSTCAVLRDTPLDKRGAERLGHAICFGFVIKGGNFFFQILCMFVYICIWRYGWVKGVCFFFFFFFAHTVSQFFFFKIFQPSEIIMVHLLPILETENIV